MVNFLIREATLDDVIGISDVHVESWIETYNGIVASSYLNALSKVEKQKMWTRIISEKTSKHYNFVAECEGEVIGFVTGGPTRAMKYEYCGEIYALYILREFQSAGIGRVLFQKLSVSLRRDGLKSMYLWVLRENKATNFYQKMGGAKRSEKIEKVGEEYHIEDLYFWDDLSCEGANK